MPKDIILKALLGGLYFFVADNEKLNSMQARKERQYANFGEYIYWSYANLQMLHLLLKGEKH